VTVAELGEPERVPESPCPSCGKVTTGRAQTGELAEGTPIGGDVSVCFYCTAVAIYTPELLLRKPSIFEEKALLNDPSVRESIAKIRGFRLRQGMAGDT
jgi:hypothetical protein